MPINPLTDGVKAKPYRGIYGMHRYFARRPHNLFQKIIAHYSVAGDMVFDPFLGGGMTAVEAFLQDRRFVGSDINPLATFVAENQIQTWDIPAVRADLAALESYVRKDIENLYRSSCNQCGEESPSDWVEWSAVTACTVCYARLTVADLAKIGPGRWECSFCSGAVKFSPHITDMLDPIAKLQRCGACSMSEVSIASAEESVVSARASRMLEARPDLPIPRVSIPDNNMQRESALFKKGYLQFSDLFTPRNLLANGLLLAAIDELPPKRRAPLHFIFSASLRYTNKMVTRNISWRKDRPLEWVKPGFWIAPVPLETNVWLEFTRRQDRILREKERFQGSLTRKPVLSGVAHVVEKVADISIGTGSSRTIALPDHSVDLIVTDPPYGSYVHYADLSNFWVSWLQGRIGAPSGVVENVDEAVASRKRGFPGAKTFEDYERLLHAVFLECWRVLKPNSWLVLTFNNREPQAWIALVKALLRAGFCLPEKGVVFQDGIEQYKKTSQLRREGSVIGDFVYSLVRCKGIDCSAHGATDISLRQTLTDGLTNAVSEACRPSADFMRALYLDLAPKLFGAVSRELRAGTSIEEFQQLSSDFALLHSERGDMLDALRDVARVTPPVPIAPVLKSRVLSIA